MTDNYERSRPQTPDQRLDDTPLRFGKYRGQTPNQIAEHDPSYVTWMRANVLPPPCSRELALACEQDVREEESDLEEWAREIADE